MYLLVQLPQGAQGGGRYRFTFAYHIGDDCSVADGDDDGRTLCDRDCNDDTPDIHGDADEVCDGVDNDCDNQVDNLTGPCESGQSAEGLFTQAHVAKKPSLLGSQAGWGKSSHLAKEQIVAGGHPGQGRGCAPHDSQQGFVAERVAYLLKQMRLESGQRRVHQNHGAAGICKASQKTIPLRGCVHGMTGVRQGFHHLIPEFFILGCDDEMGHDRACSKRG